MENKYPDAFILQKSDEKEKEQWEILCCQKKNMVTVIIKGKAACVMSELEYNKIIETERKYLQNNGLRRSA